MKTNVAGHTDKHNNTQRNNFFTVSLTQHCQIFTILGESITDIRAWEGLAKADVCKCLKNTELDRQMFPETFIFIKHKSITSYVTTGDII